MSNYIFVKKNAIKKRHCKNIIKKLNTEKLIPGQNEGIKDFYSGLQIVPQYEEWFDDFIKEFDEYTRVNSYLLNKAGRWKIDFCNYQKYKPNQFFKKEHCEHCLEYPYRMVAWMFYCNNIKKGGGTKFPQQNFIAEPEEGTLLIWPAFWTHTHFGIKAPKEYKYIVTGWGSFY